MSEALRVPATQMLDDGPFEDSWRHMIAGEGANGEQVRIHFGENERVLRTELLRNEEWVRVPKGPKLSRITCYHVMVGHSLPQSTSARDSTGVGLALPLR